MPTMRSPRFSAIFTSKRHDAAREALQLCSHADKLADEALHCVDAEGNRLFELLERRDEVLQSLAEHLVSLKLERPTADGVLLAATERAADEADDLVATVCAALDASQRATMALAARVAARVSELRAEIEGFQRAGNVQGAYATPRVSIRIDSVR